MNKDDDDDTLMATRVVVGCGSADEAKKFLDDMKAKLGDACGQMASMQLMTRADESLYLRLKAGERFIVLTKALGCIVVDGIIAPGGYEVDGADFAEYGFPCGVIAIGQDHTGLFSGMSLETVTNILDSAERSKTSGNGEVIPVDVSRRVVH